MGAIRLYGEKRRISSALTARPFPLESAPVTSAAPRLPVPFFHA
jgi:hypothetical protein